VSAGALRARQTSRESPSVFGRPEHAHRDLDAGRSTRWRAERGPTFDDAIEQQRTTRGPCRIESAQSIETRRPARAAPRRSRRRKHPARAARPRRAALRRRCGAHVSLARAPARSRGESAREHHAERMLEGASRHRQRGSVDGNRAQRRPARRRGRARRHAHTSDPRAYEVGRGASSERREPSRD